MIAAPGYILATSSTPLPKNLSVTQFIQTVMTGVSGLPGPFVRPMWQVEPPKQPDIDVNWMAIGISTAAPDANGYLGVDASGKTVSQRHETLEIACAIYGPDALETYELIRDGFQIPQNRQALTSGNMGFVEIGPGRHIPDLVNQRFINRIQTSVFLRREIQRVYPIATLLSANGIIHTVIGDEDYLLNWATPNA